MNIVKNFLETDIISSIYDTYENAKGTNTFEINEMGRWSKDLYQGNYGPVYVLRLPEWAGYFSYKFSHIPEFNNYKLSVGYMHIWNKGSGIAWHDDGGENTMAATIYLNKTWNKNSGGLFLYTHNDVNGWYCPEYNDCIWFKSPLSHSVSILSSNIEEPRLSIQLFFNKQNY